MFYSEFILTKKGPLAKVWLAAHWDKKLNKQTIANLSLEKSVQSIVDPTIPIALRTNGHLLLGVVKIYSRKVKYVLAECNETLTKIKLQAKTKDVTDENINMPAQHTTATKNQITLPEVSDLDLLLLPNAAAITLELGDNWQSNIKDITLIDFAAWTTEESFEPISLEGRVDEMIQPMATTPTTTTPTSIEGVRAAQSAVHTSGGITTIGTDKVFEGGVDIQDILPFDVTTPAGPGSPMGELGGIDVGDIGFSGFDQGPITTPGVFEGVTTPGVGEEREEEEEEQPTKKRKRKPGKLIFDEPASYSKGYYTKRMKETPPELLTERGNAPATREEFEKHAQRAASKDIWKQTPFGMDLPIGFIDFFSSAIDKANSKDKKALTEEERDREQLREQQAATTPGVAFVTPGITPIDMPTEIGGFDADLDIAPAEPFEQPTTGRGRTTLGPGELSPIAADIMIEEDIENMLISTAKKKKSATPLTDQQKKQIIEDRNRIEQELRERASTPSQTRGAPSTAGVTDRTVKVLSMLEEGFRQAESDSLSLTDMLKGKKRQTAARCFYETLVLKSKGLIDVSQSEPFGEIVINKVE